MTAPMTTGPGTPAPDPRPFLIPCRQLDTRAPLLWLRLGWQDFRRAPGLSLAYGSFVVLLSWAVTLLALRFGGWILVMAMLSGFVFVAPVIALGLYAIARELHAGRRPTLGQALAATRRAAGNAMVFSLVLLVVFLVWARAASVISIFLPVSATGALADYVAYFGVGTAVGAIFAAIAFASSAFALPLIADGAADTVTAVVSSINAVLRNPRALLVWAALVGGLLLVGIGTGYLALLVVVPVLGFGAWHGMAAILAPPGPAG